MPTTVLRTAGGVLDAADNSKLDELRNRLSTGSPKVILYLHGGLVNQADAEAMALRLSTPGGESLNAPEEWEQIYVVWRTGVLETLKSNWTDIFQNDRLYRVLFQRLISYVTDKLSQGALAGRGAFPLNSRMPDAEIERRMTVGAFAPFGDLDHGRRGAADGAQGRTAAIATVSDPDVEFELGRELRGDAQVQSIAMDLDTTLARSSNHPSRNTFGGDAAAGQATLSRLDARILREWTPIEADGRARVFSLGGALLGIVTHGVAIGKRVIGRIRSGRDHGVHATIAEEIARELYGDLIGSAIWGMMVKDAGDHFLSTRLGASLIDILASNDKIRLVVVGHSAGAIWATELLAARHKPGIAPADLILLAPAVRISKFAKMLDTAIDSIGKFRLFAMKDELERRDVLLDKFAFIYPSSLLYLVSGLFENRDADAYVDAPLLGMDRFIGPNAIELAKEDDLEAMAKVKAFLRAQPDRLIFSISNAGDGLNSSARKHGGFDNDVATLASVATYFR